MSVESWDKNEIKKLAAASGKPLEVQCAEAFLKTEWDVRLGTYYHDFSSEKVRELDILIERSYTLEGKVPDRDVMQWNLRIRILGSCKGFPSDCGPATYSLAAASNTVHKPYFMNFNRGPFGCQVIPKIGEKSANVFLARSHLDNRQVVGFDILQRKDKSSEYVRKTDRDLYEGLDSAIKAAVYWDQQDRIRFGGHNHLGYTTLNIPLLISALPFWDVSIDGGKPGDPELKHTGYHVGLYPFAENGQRTQPITSILWCASKLDELTSAMGNLFGFLADEFRDTMR